MNILITGTSGFIGRNFLEFCSNKKFKKIICVDLTQDNYLFLKKKKLKNLIYLKTNINNKKNISKILTQYKPQYIVNCAAETHVDNSIKDPKKFIKNNILSSFNFLMTVFKYWESLNSRIKKKFIFLNISTDEVYGQLKTKKEKFKNDSLIKPNNPYSASKASFDHILFSFYKTYKFPIIISRCSNNYGPFQLPEKLIPLVIHNALENLPIPIYGNGKNVRDWIYVKDHCDAIFKILQNGKIGNVYNIGSKNKITNIELVNRIC